jgi:hypothetical protein
MGIYEIIIPWRKGLHRGDVLVVRRIYTLLRFAQLLVKTHHAAPLISDYNTISCRVLKMLKKLINKLTNPALDYNLAMGNVNLNIWLLQSWCVTCATRIYVQYTE